MRRLSLAIIAAVSTLALTHVASAADLPRKAPAYTPPLPPVFSWTGMYVGANAGWAGMKYDNTYFTPGGDAPFWLPIDADPISAGGYNAFHQNRLTGGLQVGYNYQVGKFVTGLEADFNWLGFSRSSTAEVFGGTPGVVALYDTHAKIDWMVTVRPRLGIAFGQFLPYVTGGLAFVHNSFSQTVLFPPDADAAVSDSVNNTRFETTWTLGGGFEYAFAPQWSIKAEYLHVFMPDKTLTSVGPSPYFFNPSLIPYTRTIDRRIDTVRVGLNWRF